MPKVSFDPGDMYKPSANFQEGNGRIKSAVIRVHQFPPNRESQEQYPAFLAACLQIELLDAQGTPTGEEPPEKILRIEGDLNKIRPGLATSREDDDPVDQGDELGTEGNCCFAEAGVKINEGSQWGIFVRSIMDKGFKAGILSTGYMPDFVGLSALFKTEKAPKRVIGGREVESSYFKVDRILERPYEAAKPAAKPAAAAATAPANTTTFKGQAAAATATKRKPNGQATTPSPEAEAYATELMASIGADLAGETREHKRVYALALTRIVKDKSHNAALDPQVRELLNNEEWLASQAEDLGYTFQNKVFTFGGASEAA